MIFFIPPVVGTLVIPAIFAGIYYLVKRKGFSKVFAWATVIMCVMSYFGNSSKSDSLQSGQMKVIDINYSPKESFEAKGLTPMNLEILEYDKL